VSIATTSARVAPAGADRLSSGVVGVDDLLGGLIPGDNVVWASDDPRLFSVVEAALFRSAREAQAGCVYVTATRPPSTIERELGHDVTVLDARPRRQHSGPAALEEALVGIARHAPSTCVVVDGLDAFATRWGDAPASAFFGRVCPRLFDLEAIAYWRAPRPAVSRRVIERVTSVTQCVVELSRGRVRLAKAEGRPLAVQGQLLRAEFTAGGLTLAAGHALGRLARGLERVRRDRGLTQTELARLADVTASAISQAEAGRRGLSIDTLLLLADRLGVTVDEMLTVAPPSGYVVARRDRAGRAAAVTPLLDDPKTGMRAFLVRLAPGEIRQPPRPHKGVELVLVARGLVQLELGPDTPVLRTGDAALATTAPVVSWRNLTSEPAVLFWIVRDPA
jgi:transcriptional regulator with XRE-family HTH domain